MKQNHKISISKKIKTNQINVDAFLPSFSFSHDPSIVDQQINPRGFEEGSSCVPKSAKN